MTTMGKRLKYQSEDDRPVTISLRLPKELHTRLEQYATQHRQSISELMRDGIEWRMGEGDPRGFGEGSGTHNPQEYYGKDAREHDTQAAEALQEVRALLAQQWEQIQALAQALERQTVLTRDGVYSSNTSMPATDTAPMTPMAPLPATPVPGGNDEQRETITASPENNYYEQIQAVPLVTAIRAEQRAIVPDQSDTVPAYDTSKHHLGPLCHNTHAWGSTGQSLRNAENQCLACKASARRDKRAKQRQHA